MEFPDDEANVFSVEEILKEADISNVKKIHETGAIIRIEFEWWCDIGDDDCKPDYNVKRLDGESKSHPHLMNRVYHYMEDGIDKRDYYRYIGVKLLLVSRGKAALFSLTITML